MSDVLTIDEINRRYPDEWVLIGDPKIDESGRVARGEVLHHSRHRDDVYREAQQTPVAHIATHFTGSVPEGVVRVL